MWHVKVIVPLLLSGLGAGLFGAVLGYFLGALREHAEWVKDQKRLEYRELLDQLYETVTEVDKARPNASDVYDRDLLGTAVKNLARVFNDRIFVAAELKQNGAVDDWLEMKKVIQYDANVDPKELLYTRNGLFDREDKLREKLLGLATRDLVRFKILPRFR